MAKGKKTGGRQPGSLNKKTLALDACEGEGINSFVNMARIASDDSHPHYWDANKELCQYLAPKLKAVEHSADQENGFVVKIIEYGSEKK